MFLRRYAWSVPALTALLTGGCMYTFNGNVMDAIAEYDPILPVATPRPPAATPSSPVVGPASLLAAPVPGKVAPAEARVKGVLGPFSVTATMPFSVQDAMPLYVGNKVYLLGGVQPSGSTTDQILVADVYDNGDLGAFTSLPDVKLVTPRNSGWVTRVGQYVYVIGGFKQLGFGPAAKVEVATLNADGTLGSFAEVAGVQMAVPRGAFVGINTGTYLTVVGGKGDYDVAAKTTDVTSTERAVIASDGSIGPFQKVDNPLMERRSGMSGFRVDDALYVTGGKTASDGGSTTIPTVERATIGPDGSLGPFSAVTSTLSVPRVGHGSVPLSDDVYAVGGFTGVRTFLTAVDRGGIGPSGNLSGFGAYADSTLAEAYSGGVVVQVSDKAVYYIGGYNPATRNEAKIQRAPILKVAN